MWDRLPGMLDMPYIVPARSQVHMGLASVNSLSVARHRRRFDGRCKTIRHQRGECNTHSRSLRVLEKWCDKNHLRNRHTQLVHMSVALLDDRCLDRQKATVLLYEVARPCTLNSLNDQKVARCLQAYAPPLTRYDGVQTPSSGGGCNDLH